MATYECCWSSVVRVVCCQNKKETKTRRKKKHNSTNARSAAGGWQRLTFLPNTTKRFIFHLSSAGRGKLSCWYLLSQEFFACPPKNPPGLFPKFFFPVRDKAPSFSFKTLLGDHLIRRIKQRKRKKNPIFCCCWIWSSKEPCEGRSASFWGLESARTLFVELLLLDRFSFFLWFFPSLFTYSIFSSTCSTERRMNKLTVTTTCSSSLPSKWIQRETRCRSIL